MSVSSVIEQIRKQAKANWITGKEQEKIRKFELVKELEIKKANELCYEWRRVNWFISDGWNADIKKALESLGYKVTEFHDDSMNVWIDWPKGTNPP